MLHLENYDAESAIDYVFHGVIAAADIVKVKIQKNSKKSIDYLLKDFIIYLLNSIVQY